MASINTNVGGIDFAVTKQADGTYTISTESMPGSSFGPDGESVAGHWGTSLTSSNIADAVKGTQNLIDNDNWNINNKLSQINDPSITDALYKEKLQLQVANIRAQLDQHQAQLSAVNGLQGQISSLQGQVDAASTAEAPASESSTNEQNTAAQTAQPTASVAPPAREIIKEDMEDGVRIITWSDGTTEYIDERGNTSTTDSSGKFISNLEDPTQPYTGGTDVTNAGVVNNSNSSPNADSSNNGGATTRSIFPKGGVSASASSAGVAAKWSDATDVRAILRVPPGYLSNITDPAGVLRPFGGIVFPYTPAISFSHDATYTGVNPTHSNYTQYFYKNSAVSAISVSAKFTVQNENDAAVLVGVITLLRALTKMKFGPDADAGAPPPVCRFNAYGNFMLSNVPVTVASFKHDLPDGVDYFQTDIHRAHGLNFVPMLSVITLTLNPTYSRAEMQRVGVSGAIAGRTQRAGFL